MSSIQVTAEEVQSTASQLASGQQQLQSVQNQLTALVRTMGESWRGQASTSFQECYQEFNNGFGQVNDALNKIQQGLVATANTYKEAEGSIAHHWAV